MGFERTVFLTYMFETSVISGTTVPAYVQNQGYGYASAIHCNYIQRIETNTMVNKTINMVVPDGSLLPFLKESFQINPLYNGEGFTAKRLLAVVQIVNGTGSTITPDPAAWSVVDVTPQLAGYPFVGGAIPSSAFDASTIITIAVQDVLNAQLYNLSYLNNPNKLAGDDNKLAFGEEAFFFGNVNTDIQAIAYTTEIPAVLPLNQYNSTTNETWDQASPVTISEMGVFNSNDDLVGIGKLNNPIDKSSTIYRTILFSIDF